MFIALIILSMSLIIYSAGSRYQTLEKEPVREIVQTITDDFKRMLATASSSDTIKDDSQFKEAVSNWAEKTQYCYSGIGLQLNTSIKNLIYSPSVDVFQIDVDAELKMNITSLGFYGYVYPTSLYLKVERVGCIASLVESTENYMLKELNITIKANNEDGPASDLTITGIKIRIYCDLLLKHLTLTPENFTGNQIEIENLNIEDVDIVIVQVMTKDGVSVGSVRSDKGNYISACAYSFNGGPRVEMWYLKNPSNGFDNISIKMNNYTQGGVVYVFGLKYVDVKSPIGSMSNERGESNQSSVPIKTLFDYSWIISMVGVSSEVGIACDSSQIPIWSYSGNGYSTMGTYERKPTAGYDEQNWTLQTPENPFWVASSIEIKQSFYRNIPIDAYIDIIYLSGEGEYEILLKKGKSFDTGLPKQITVYKYEIVVGFQDSRGIYGELTFTFKP